ncbi:hypothetical protein KBA73_03290 [Patescibacteria group bacterium]|nr:hypothetical protein [Patescibacteria group bacterium]
MPAGFIPQTSGQETMPVAVPSTPETESEISSVEADARAMEHAQEVAAEDTFLEEDLVSASTAAASPVVVAPEAPLAPAATATPKDEALLEVERILEDGLGEFVTTLPDAPRERFMTLGRQVAAQIAQMVRGYKVKVREVVHLIREWLLVIPGVNTFFLEQEAKLKTDRILAFEEQYHTTHAALT